MHCLMTDGLQVGPAMICAWGWRQGPGTEYLRRGAEAASLARMASRSRLSVRCKRAARDRGVRLRARPLGRFRGGE